MLVFISFVLLVLLMTVVMYDVTSFRIPNLLVAAIALLFLAEAVLILDLETGLKHLAAGLIAFVAGFALYCFRLLGGGDAKLLAATGLWAGLGHLVSHFLMFALLGGALAIVLVVVRRGLEKAPVLSNGRFAFRTPRALTVGESIPYGVPIAVSLILIRFGYDPFGPALGRLPFYP